MSRKYIFKEKEEAYFISFATVFCWTRARYSRQQEDTLNFMDVKNEAYELEKEYCAKFYFTSVGVFFVIRYFDFGLILIYCFGYP